MRLLFHEKPHSLQAPHMNRSDSLAWRTLAPFVGGRQFIAPEKSAAHIPTLTKIDAMFFVHLRMTNVRFRACCCVYMCKKAAMP